MGSKALIYKQKTNSNRDLRNEMAHDYEDNDYTAINILNAIDKLKNELLKILDDIQAMVR